MGLGKRIWQLWQLKTLVVLTLLLSLLVSVWSVANISLIPLKLTPRALQMATATTHVIVDTPQSSVLDLRQNTYSLQALTQRAVLLGNVMANGQVRETMARKVHVTPDRLQISAPLTPKEPRAATGAENQKKTSDILKSTDQYRLAIEANPTVPVLDIYSQAPTAEAAATLANASVAALRDYLKTIASDQSIPSDDQIRLLQLGHAKGKVINNGIDYQAALLAFLLTFAFGSATVIAISRVGRGWQMAALAEQQEQAAT
jgi:hypothetical protein